MQGDGNKCNTAYSYSGAEGGYSRADLRELEPDHQRDASVIIEVSGKNLVPCRSAERLESNLAGHQRSLRAKEEACGRGLRVS